MYSNPTDIISAIAEKMRASGAKIPVLDFDPAYKERNPDGLWIGSTIEAYEKAINEDRSREAIQLRFRFKNRLPQYDKAVAFLQQSGYIEVLNGVWLSPR